MPKKEWGVKRVCPTTGKRFYDLNRNPIISPYTGEIADLDADKSLIITARSEDAVLKDEKAVDADLGDDVLDDEDESVSLDDLTEVASEDNQ
ncbi:MAG: TIGR02300 family protein [Rhodobacteraceae bacterium]|nr:TIGR02300 family protein [Paracoccaceae bacterium]